VERSEREEKRRRRKEKKRSGVVKNGWLQQRRIAAKEGGWVERREDGWDGSEVSSGLAASGHTNCKCTQRDTLFGRAVVRWNESQTRLRQRRRGPWRSGP